MQFSTDAAPIRTIQQDDRDIVNFGICFGFNLIGPFSDGVSGGRFCGKKMIQTGRTVIPKIKIAIFFLFFMNFNSLKFI